MRTDTERIDGLQHLLGTYAGRVICRWSETGRGWRLHETNKEESFEHVRTAIDVFLDNFGTLPDKPKRKKPR